MKIILPRRRIRPFKEKYIKKQNKDWMKRKRRKKNRNLCKKHCYEVKIKKNPFSLCCPWRDKIKIKEVNKKYNFTIHAILLPILNSTFIFSRFSYIFFLIKLPYNFSLDWLQMAVKWRECSTIDCTLWIKYLLLIKYRFSSHSSFVLNSFENVFFKRSESVWCCW